MVDCGGLVRLPSLVNSAVDVMLVVLCEETVERPRTGTCGVSCSSEVEAMRARVSIDSRLSPIADLDLVKAVSSRIKTVRSGEISSSGGSSGSPFSSSSPSGTVGVLKGLSIINRFCMADIRFVPSACRC